MKLPIIKENSTKLRGLSTCIGKDHCSECKLYSRNGGRCSGCTPLHKQALGDHFKACYQECNSCNVGYKVNTTAICCRSPLTESYLTALCRGLDFNNPVFNPTKQAKLSFTQRAILNYAFGSLKQIAPEDSILFPDQEVVVSPLSYLKGKGDLFYSHNLKEYLKLASSTKLIASTMSIDDHLEAAWEKEQYGGKEFYGRVGIDYWAPLAFSIFSNQAKMFQYYQLLRMLWSAEFGQSHFVIASVPKVSFEIKDLLETWLEACPQVMFNAQMSTNDSLLWYKGEVASWDKIASPDIPFWFIGASTPLFMVNIREVIPKREIYWVSSKPLWCANSGKIFRKDGGEARADFEIPKKQLLYQNVETFQNIVNKYG